MTVTAFKSTSGAAPRGRLGDYVAMARLDHAAKHVFIVPGVVLAFLLRGIQSDSLVRNVLFGLIASVCIASANYVINEWLDRDFDRHHPTKSLRPSVQKSLDGRLIWLEWALLVVIGLTCAYLASRTLLVTAAIFALQGLVYNVPPIRTKDVAYADVISESVNNPLRLIIGWAMVDPTTLPPSSIILTYWLGGAFLMGAKRLSEYREIVAAYGKPLLTRYRASFKVYSEISLLTSCFVYAIGSSFFLAIFLIKYRIEYILTFPVITVLFAHYLSLSMKAGSAAQKPEKLYRERGLIGLVMLLAAVFAVTTVARIPQLERLTSQHYIALP